VTPPFTFKNILREKRIYGNSNIPPKLGFIHSPTNRAINEKKVPSIGARAR